MYDLRGKRAADLIVSMLAIIMLSPIMLITAVLIRLFDSGSVIFRQVRVGRNGQLFTLFKFRSLPIGTQSLPSDQVGKIKVSWLGRIIRRTNIDELPQLFNILRGDMSVVGPRPAIVQQEKLTSLRRQSGALSCRPGLTGLAQIRSFDGMTIEQKADFDAEYARHVTLLRDFSIILKTFVYLVKRPPLY